MRFRTAAAVLGLMVGCFLAAPAEAQEEKEWGYNKGFFFRTPDFELKISTRTQFRYTLTNFDETSAFEDRQDFTIPRARLRLDGFAFRPWIKYKVQYDFTGQVYNSVTGINIPGNFTCDPAATEPCEEPDQTVSLGVRTGPDLRDLYFDITRNPWASVRLGQFKAPFGVQELTSSGDQQFVDRSIASALFAPSRDQGVMLYGTSFGKAFGYEAGLFNGNFRNRSANDNDKLLYAARVHWDPNGEYKLSESAVDHPTTPNYTFSLGYLLNWPDSAGELKQDTREGMFGLKYLRFSVLVDAYLRTQESASGDVDSEGYNAQIGVFLIPSKLEVAGRWSRTDPNTSLEDNEQTETRLGFGYYFNKHDLKVQADYGRIRNEASATDTTTDIFRAQFQIVF